MKAPLNNTHIEAEILKQLTDYVEISGRSRANIIEAALSDYFSNNPVTMLSPVVTISDSFLHMNRRAIELLETERVALSYDPGKNAIILQAVETGGYKLAKDNRVFCRSLLKNNDITVRGKFEAEYKEKQQTLYVKI